MEDEFFEEEDETTEPVEPAAAAAAAAADKKDEKPPTAAELADLKKENARLQSRLSEETESSRFWHERAKGGNQPAPKEPEKEVKLDEDAVDVISSGDPKRITAMLKKLGFVARDEVTSEIQRTRTEVVSEQQLLQDYPELKDQSSEFFKTTAKHVGALKADPDMARSPRIYQVAAQLANAELNGGKKTETAEERAERVGRQSGDRSRRPANRGAQADEANANELSAAQKDMVAKFKAAGADITEDGYKKRAQAGVRMGGAPARRR